MAFKIGQTYKVKYEKLFGSGARTYKRAFSGNYELIRSGAKMYLFCNDNGEDWYPTKKELEAAIEAAK